MIHPPTVVWALLGEGVAGAGMVVGRVAGIALLSLAVACWPGRDAVSGRTPGLAGMVTYNLLVTLYLFRLGVGGEWAGKLLWPGCVFHALLTLLLARAWIKTGRPAKANR